MRRAAILLVLLAGCPDPEEGVFTCPDGACPSGWFCHSDGYCRADPEDLADAAMDASDDAAVDGGADAGEDAATDAGPDAEVDACVPGSDAVDLLLVVDDSVSMSEEQEELVAAFPDLVRALATGQPMPGGAVEFPPIDDLHVGVVSSDMGTGGFVVPTCPDSDFGGDGVLTTTVRSSDATCPDALPAFLEYETAGLSRFRRDFACKATLGTNGCGFEQQLEAMLKAITPSTSALEFHGGTVGHADGVNAGFLRPDSVLVVLIVSDEEDCSAANPALFQTMGGPFPGDLNSRCVEYHDAEGALHPISRYVDGLRDLRPGAAGRVVFAPLVGVPVDLQTAAWDAILEDDAMELAIDPMTLGPSTACERVEGGVTLTRASPGVRYVETAQELDLLGSQAVLGSICAPSYAPFFRRLLAAINGAVDVSTCD
ncbi:MAG TPA: hypothetical protein RMH85_06735 [Polyangiaceae bacterium LLY-WYZ-15_(1-7)]|nr:hypothetical protein [Myxococcales bacterium]MAT24232.1 hypothetical protein [Sandaracinus sp.]HJL03737.1 hypothetical protein [Polyangiaceae bacterium LLY-WYZ-15_(1-7)]MBJ71928.1 hypothetical protein [Sandaracinus sp.]HJL08173.1 hypothetical protein [Polyangiaceae bacterium LLY-WYZ-15_(1-7)]